jgi:hypothetical protein
MGIAAEANMRRGKRAITSDLRPAYDAQNDYSGGAIIMTEEFAGYLVINFWSFMTRKILINGV